MSQPSAGMKSVSVFFFFILERLGLCIDVVYIMENVTMYMDGKECINVLCIIVLTLGFYHVLFFSRVCVRGRVSCRLGYSLNTPAKSKCRSFYHKST